MDAPALIAGFVAEAEALGAAAAVALDAAVPTCPGWSVTDLVVHTGKVHRWTAAVLAAGDRVRQRDVDGPGDQPLLEWYEEGVEVLQAAFAGADPDAPTWTFSGSGDRRVWWWMRRQALETALHRWDAQGAAGVEPAAVAAELAAEGMEEYLVDMLPGAAQRQGGAGLTGTLHLHATDEGLDGGEWLVDLDARPVSALPGHVKADTAVRGSASDLLLWLWNRLPVSRLQVFGSPGVLEAWPQLQL